MKESHTFNLWPATLPSILKFLGTRQHTPCMQPLGLTGTAKGRYGLSSAYRPLFNEAAGACEEAQWKQEGGGGVQGWKGRGLAIQLDCTAANLY